MNLVFWILDFLTKRTQTVRINGLMSDQVWSSSAPYKDLCSHTYLSCTQISVRAKQRAILKYADDFVIVGELQDNKPNPVLNGVMSTDCN